MSYLWYVSHAVGGSLGLGLSGACGDYPHSYARTGVYKSEILVW